MNLMLLFLTIGLFRHDTVTIETLISEKLVDKYQMISKERFHELKSCVQLSFGSAKLTYAIIIGKELGGLFLATGLSLMVCLPSLAIYCALLYGIQQFLSIDQLYLIQQGIIPVLAAYFIHEALRYVMAAKRVFSFTFIILILLVSVILIVILNIPIVYVLVLMLIFFLCFIKGGSLHD